MRLKSFHQPLGWLLVFVSTQLGITVKFASAQVAPSTPLQQQVEAKKICPAQLTELIDGIANRPQYSRFRWGILIQTLSTSQTLYNRDGEKFFLPASNVKLLTTAAVLHKLGADFRVRTSINASKDGALVVVGRGDPSLTDVQLRELAQQLKQQGINQVNQVIADDTYFTGDIIDSDWEWGDLLESYAAPVNSLILNQNTVSFQVVPQAVNKPLRIIWQNPTETVKWKIQNETVTTQQSESTFVNVSREWQSGVLRIRGNLNVNSPPQLVTIAVVNPVEHFLRHLRQALAVEGIKTTDTRQNIPSDLVGSEIAAIESPPLSVLVMETNQNSNNLYAESLLRSLGAETNKLKDNSQNTATLGLEAVKASLTELGVNSETYILADGSGLSRHNLVSPKALVQTLQAMAKSPQAQVFRASLPVAGVSGSLKNRFLNTPAVGIVSAKTGTMSGVVALSGYAIAPLYQPLVFSMIVNQSDLPASKMRQVIDEMVVLLTQLQQC